jgi:hypothetical protein
MSTWKQRWYDELDKPINHYLALPGHATLGQALALFRAPDIDGAAYWHLVVARSDGEWAYAQFGELIAHFEANGEAALDTPLDAVEALHIAEVDQAVDLLTIGIGQAKRDAGNSPGKLLIVLEEQRLAGVLFEGTERLGAAALSTSALNELPGRFADLSEFRRLLITPRRPPPTEPSTDDEDQTDDREG